MHCSKQRPLCDALLGFHNPWQSDREGRPAAWLALDRDVAAHHLAEAFTDRESKARATVFARRGGGSLGKLLEQLAHLLRRHADAGVGHRDRDPVAAVLLSEKGTITIAAHQGPESGKIRLVESRKIAKEKSENSDAMRTLLRTAQGWLLKGDEGGTKFGGWLKMAIFARGVITPG
jgi:hypothetical protein